MSFQLIVGLGNPEQHRLNTRHNAGFWFLDQLSDNHWQSFGQYQLSQYGNIILIKPLTGINSSGMVVSEFLNDKAIDQKNILLVYDDVDIHCGKVKFKRNCSSRHNGVRNMIEQLGTQQFAHLRIGIGKPENIRLLDYVLSAPNKEEQHQIDLAIQKVCSDFPMLLENEDAFVRRLQGTKL